MKRKIIGIILTLILISSPLTLFANAGSEKNPELEDETGERRSTIDIKSVWFFEKPDEPEYLYVNMKLANFKIFRIGQSFSVDFKINNKRYDVWLDKFFFIEFYYLETVQISGQVKKINSIISWKVPKSLIENPKAGGKITDISPSSVDGLYLRFRVIIPMQILEKWFNISYNDFYDSEIPILKKFYDYSQDVFNFAIDWTESEGKDYIIQY
ncbi:MAG: hypothetical protein JXA91_03595 [Candidatus Thermoplasmatota archaeon]|nr:hypothetical protein [Candidatus Thermoplasmatota archaeon]